ncbi:unnamed protein product [Rhodiola kirilowii]
MEKISAASAMEWSIELDKGLRSRKPGAAVEAVRKIGPRLEQWSREPKYTMAAYSMFGLVPGEDRLFASAILLKLADAFRVGERAVRRAVVELFLSELKNRRKRKRGEGSCDIFSKCTEENCLELMQRVKVAFNKEDDIESGADCLVLFGCWAGFAGDNADVRHLVLASLGSVHEVEVKAALFAAGCFCEHSDDFAYVVLHILVNLVASAKTSCTVKLAGIRVFGRMQSSFVITQRAYKAALTLMHNSTDENVLIVLLMTLSKLASKTTLLVSEQVNLLCSVLNQETTLRTIATALRSLKFIYNTGCYFRVSAQLLESLLSVLVHPQVPDILQYEAVEILQKILFHTSPSLMDVIDSSKLLETLQSVSQSQSSINRVLAVKIMGTTATMLKKETEVESSKVSSDSYVISLIIEKMTMLSRGVVDHNSHTDSGSDKEGLSLCKILILLVRKHPDHCLLVVDKMCSLIRLFDQERETIMDTSQPGLPVHAITDSHVYKIKPVGFKLLQGICRVLSDCVGILFGIGAINTEIIGKLISTFRLSCEISYRSCSSMLDFLPLHPRMSWTTLLDEKNCLLDKEAIWDEYLSEFEILALECAKNMLEMQAYWPAYRYGVRAACQGVYIVLIFICEHLMTKVRIGIYYFWLKSLVEFAYFEWGTEQISLPKPSILLENWLKANNVVVMHPWHSMEKVTVDAFLKTDVSGYSRKLLHTHSNICSAIKTLDSSLTTYEGFHFQRWFLALKAKLYEGVSELLRIVSSHVTSQESAGYKEQFEHGSLVKCTRTSGQYVSLSASVSHLSSRLKRLALEFDLMLTSCVDLDIKSSSIISALALSSSVLAFSARYALLFPDSFPPVNDSTSRRVNISDSSLIHYLVCRLSHVDEETTKNIGLLLKVVGIPKGCFHLPSRIQALAGSGTKELIRVCNHAMTGFVSLQNDISSIPQNDNPSKVAKSRAELITSSILTWLAIPFGIPKSFFHCRPRIGSELFVMNADPRKPDSLSTPVGCSLALNLCIQLKNLPPKFSPRTKFLSCILQCRPSFQVPKPSDHVKGRPQSALPVWEADYLIDLNQKLLHHVTECKVTESSCQEIAEKDSVYAFVRLVLNEKHQGFSASVLDVSCFPTGSYELRWLSCYVDDQGAYWSVLPLNAAPTITIHNV